MSKPHKHAELIKAWADGAEIEMFARPFGKWMEDDNPSWDVDSEYRIKPEKVYPKSSLSDQEIVGMLNQNRGQCQSITMARIIADAAVKRYIQDNEEN